MEAKKLDIKFRQRYENGSSEKTGIFIKNILKSLKIDKDGHELWYK